LGLIEHFEGGIEESMQLRKRMSEVMEYRDGVLEIHDTSRN
jgi:hypothetical protein